MTKPYQSLSFILQNIIIIDIITCALIFAGFLLIRPDLVLLVAWLLIYPYFRLTRRNELLKYFLLSTLFGLIWFYLSRDLIEYSQDMLSINGYQFFVLFAWSLGLVLFRMLYNDGRKRLKIKSRGIEFLIFSLLFCIFLTIAEAVGYHFCNINNELAREYSGLPVLDALHGPVWQKLGYMLTGPVYLFFSLFLEKLK